MKKLNKILFIVLDGLGERPLDKLDGKTPLEAANSSNMDQLAKDALCGEMEPVFTKALPTSEEGHFALFGYDPGDYGIKRGIFTVKGAGLDVNKGDVCLRGNFATVDENLDLL